MPQALLSQTTMLDAHILYDLDGTLFALPKYLHLWCDAVQASFGIPSAQAWDTSEVVKDDGYTFAKHLGALGVPENRQSAKLIHDFHALIAAKKDDWLFDDTMPHLEAGLGRKRSILTFGDAEFQQAKIDGVGIHSFFDDIRIASQEMTKSMHIKELVEQGETDLILLEDSPNQLQAVYEAGLPVKLIRIRREGQERHTESHPLDNEAWPVISTLHELEEAA
ncbi:hypothetical protein HYV73_03805 [Candidatus Uhrbacteria bacterium]|nr:hypothetical protein [Candidatus Uhrbacteria bacterium]